jgi:hypothetical protein
VKTQGGREEGAILYMCSTYPHSSIDLRDWVEKKKTATAQRHHLASSLRVPLSDCYLSRGNWWNSAQSRSNQDYRPESATTKGVERKRHVEAPSLHPEAKAWPELNNPRGQRPHARGAR